MPWNFQNVKVLVLSIGYVPGSMRAQMVKNLPAMQETRVWSLGQEDPLGKEMATHPIFLPGEFHEQRSLVGHSLWGHKELDTTEWLNWLNWDGCLDLSKLFLWEVKSDLLTLNVSWSLLQKNFLANVVHPVTQSCLTLRNPLDWSLPDSSVHGIFQARILECVAISFSGDLPHQGLNLSLLGLLARIGRQILYHCTTWEAPS